MTVAAIGALRVKNLLQNQRAMTFSPGMFCFVCFDSLRPLNNLSVMRDGSSWVEPVLS